MVEAPKQRRGLLDLEAQLAFFRSQHRHPVNAAAHALLTWPLLFATFVLLHFLPLPVDPALALVLVYAAAFVAADRRAGALLALLFLAAWAGSRAVAARVGFAGACKVAVPTLVVCWAGQVVGHGVFEKIGPTPSELSEVFLMEPFLIFLQILNKLFGYEPYPGFIKNVDKRMEADSKESSELKQRKVA